jgi:Xaa-Pro aminopeptidase
MNYPERIKNLRKSLAEGEKFPYLISDLMNIKYLTGFSGSYAYIIFGKKYTCFITDSRYEEAASALLDRNTDLVLQKTDMINAIRECLPKQEKKLYIEEHSASLSFFTVLKKNLKGVRIIPAGDDVNTLRIIKDEDEIVLLRKAADIVDECFLQILKFIKPGITEWDISNEIEFFFRKKGCRKSSFPSIVASGTGSSMPHYETSMKKKIKSGEPILIDMGCEFSGYNSDLTRTLFSGRIDKKIEKI